MPGKQCGDGAPRDSKAAHTQVCPRQEGCGKAKILRTKVADSPNEWSHLPSTLPCQGEWCALTSVLLYAGPVAAVASAAAEQCANAEAGSFFVARDNRLTVRVLIMNRGGAAVARVCYMRNRCQARQARSGCLYLDSNERSFFSDPQTKGLTRP